jgi:hypothetical protein
MTWRAISVRLWLQAGERIELSCRLAALIVRLHYVQLGATAARGVLLKLRPMLRRRAAEMRDLMVWPRGKRLFAHLIVC